MSQLNCKVTGDLLSLYAEDLVSPETAALVEEHLQNCPDCRETLARMKTAVAVTSKPAEPAKKVQRYVVGLRIWYLLCPLVAFMLLLFGLDRATHLYIGLLAVISAVCIASQFLAGASVGIDYEQVRMSEESAKRSRRRWGGFYASPLQICLPALVPVLVAGARNVYVTMPELFSPLLFWILGGLAVVLALLCVANKHMPK